MKYPAAIFFFLLALGAQAFGNDELVVLETAADAPPLGYVLNAPTGHADAVLILFPGGDGIVNAHREDGRVVYQKRGNFLLRVRPFFVARGVATVTTDSTADERRVDALLNDIARRFAHTPIYLMGTSRGTHDTMSLAPFLSKRIAGVIHSSSVAAIGFFDARNYANRQLLVHHYADGCAATPFAAASRAHLTYGTPLLVMHGGLSRGDPCAPFAHHGFNGIEEETVTAIVDWLRQGPVESSTAPLARPGSD